MIYADKENLKTHVAQEILLVRAKEMKFYTRNLSMLGTHAALLAGFAFTILSQHNYKTPIQGYMSYEDEYWLGMWPENTTSIADLDRQLQRGIGAWPWTTFLQQLFQLLHLMFTAMGILLHLWTVYTTVVTNILGLHLALRGPEGSVDRAVRHMGLQNQFALRKFLWGLVLFNASLLFFCLSEYHIFISFFVVVCICILASYTFVHIKELATIFYLGDDELITGQWIGLDGPARGAAVPASAPAAFATRNSTTGRRGSITAMSQMVSGRIDREDGTRQGAKTSKYNLREGLGRAAERMHLKRPTMGVKGTRWASTLAEGKGVRTEEQVPSRVAERLIFNQQVGADSMPNNPALRRLHRSNSRRLRWQGSSFRLSERHPEASSTRADSSSATNEVADAVAEALLQQRRAAAATALQSRARGRGGRDRFERISRESMSSMQGDEATADAAESADINSLVGNVLDKLGFSSLPPLGWDAPGVGGAPSGAMPESDDGGVQRQFPGRGAGNGRALS